MRLKKKERLWSSKSKWKKLKRNLKRGRRKQQLSLRLRKKKLNNCKLIITRQPVLLNKSLKSKPLKLYPSRTSRSKRNKKR